MNKVCKTNGLTKFTKRADGYYRCRKCSAESVNKRRKKLKILALEYKGNKCLKCGYDKCIGALEFHHRNPKDKSFSISSSGNTRSWDKMRIELDKCDLLCANCHREEHYNDELP